jgi:hypothetical protein
MQLGGVPDPPASGPWPLTRGYRKRDWKCQPRKEKQMQKLVGYLEGADALWLTQLQLAGIDTLPLSNGYDGHGLSIQQLNPQHKVGLVVGYMHKFIPPRHLGLSVTDILHNTKVYDIPVLIACPQDGHSAARERLGEMPANAELVDCKEIVARIKTLLGA